jgi:hypothetical protein
LHDADQLLSPALARTVAAIGPPESDAALVRLAEIVAGAIDGMSAAERRAMLGQTAPLVLKVLAELEDRRRRREGPPVAPRVENPVDAMRRAHATRSLRGV